MPCKQTRIFLPFDVPYDNDNWAETLIGRIIRPLVQEFPVLEWFWFSRYAEDAQGSGGGCNLAAIPPTFAKNGIYRSVRFRYSIPDQTVVVFEQRCLELIGAAGCRISDFPNYDHLDDLASQRFVGGDYTPERREQRAIRMAEFLCATSRFIIDALEGPDADGRFAYEINNDVTQNPNRNTFESVHHLFCNMTNVPTDVLVADLIVGTRMYPQIKVKPVRVRF